MTKIPSQATKKKKSLLENLPEPTDKYKKKYILFSYLDFDVKQSESFEDWQKLELLAEKTNKFHHYSKLRLDEAFSDKFKIYKGFPEKCGYKFPETLSKDAKWCSMHIKGKECVIGHIVENIFYIVFLDKDHKFYPTEKKNT